MKTYSAVESTKKTRLPNELLHSTFSIPSSFTGNYEGDLTMFKQSSTPPSKRRITFRTDSDDEFSDTSPFDERRQTVETLRNRLFLYELSPRISKVILRNIVYQKLIQLITIVVFLLALIVLTGIEMLKQAMIFVLKRRSYLFAWKRNPLCSTFPAIITLLLGFCYFQCQTGCYQIH